MRADLVPGQVAHHLAAEQVHRCRLARSGRPARRGDHDVVGVGEPGGDQRSGGEDRGDRVAAGVGHPVGRCDALALRRAVRAARTSRPGGARRRSSARAPPGRRAGGPSRGPRASSRSSCAASAADAPCGSARNTRSASGEGGRRRCRRGRGPRPSAGCGWTSPTRWPALPCAVTATTSRSGCAATRRSSSPPGVPAGAGDRDAMTHVHEYARLCMFIHNHPAGCGWVAAWTRWWS